MLIVVKHNTAVSIADRIELRFSFKRFIFVKLFVLLVSMWSYLSYICKDNSELLLMLDVNVWQSYRNIFEKPICRNQYLDNNFYICLNSWGAASNMYPRFSKDKRISLSKHWLRLSIVYKYLFWSTYLNDTTRRNNRKGSICHDERVAYGPFQLSYTSFQSTSPFPISSSSMARVDDSEIFFVLLQADLHDLNGVQTLANQTWKP